MNISLILERKYSGAQWSLDGFDYDGLVWLSNTSKPSKEELESHWDSVLEEIEQEKIEAIAKRQALLNKLGITEEEARLLLGGN